MLCISATVAEADEPSAVSGSGLKPAFPMRAMIDRHSMSVDRGHSAACAEVAFRAALGPDARSCTMAVETVNAPIGVADAPAAVRRAGRRRVRGGGA